MWSRRAAGSLARKRSQVRLPLALKIGDGLRMLLGDFDENIQLIVVSHDSVR